MTLHRLSLGALGALALLAPAAGCGSEEDQPKGADAPQLPQGGVPAAGAPAQAPGRDADRDPQGDPPARKPPRIPSGPAEGPSGDPRVTELEREAAAAVRAYVGALDSRQGERVCALLGPGAIEQVALPVARRGCAASLDASIGYRDPRGLPVWDGAEVLEIRSVRTRPGEASVVATVLTRFADRSEPSLEDDVVHLTRTADRWLVAKPSSTLYRAVGIADVPPSVLAPP